jgi:enoyl-[acyl-carrier-protein] reductase (NADH)
LELIDEKHQHPEGHVGATTAFLATDYAKLMTGETVYADGGYHIVG